MKDKPDLLNRDQSGDWTEDFGHENGNYINTCIECKTMFKGHKRRVICRTCNDAPIDWQKLSEKKMPDDKKGYPAGGCWLDGKMVGFAECMVKKVAPLQSRVSDLERENDLMKEDRMRWNELFKTEKAEKERLEKEVEELRGSVEFLKSVVADKPKHDAPF